MTEWQSALLGWAAACALTLTIVWLFVVIDERWHRRQMRHRFDAFLRHLDAEDERRQRGEP